MAATLIGGPAVDPRAEAIDCWLHAWDRRLVWSADNPPGTCDSARQRATTALKRHGSPFVHRGRTWALDDMGNAMAVGGMPCG
jgi:hypothetical protein